MASNDLLDSKNPAAALEKAVELNRIKTGDAPKITIKLDSAQSEKSCQSASSEADRKGSEDSANVQFFGDKLLINLEDCRGELASDLSERKKWITLFIVSLVQLSMNLNCSLYSNAIPGISNKFGVDENAARWGATVFLVAYAFGCELWAPWSEELGRYWVLEASLGLLNITQFGVVFATNISMVIAFRTLGGLSTAGGSITLGMVADMWDKERHQIPVAFVVFASVGGSVLGPIIGGLIEEYASWEWAIWVQLIFGGAIQFLHYFLVPETRATILMDCIAERKRAEAKKDGRELNLWGPNEVTPFAQRFSWQEIFVTWLRPFKMFCTEPIVLCLSLLSGFSDGLIFMFIQSFGLVYRQWGFNSITIGLAFLPFLVGYIIAWISFIPAIRRNKKERADHPTCERAQFESRLWWLLYLAPCLPIGLIGFAWTSGGPPIHWFGSMVFTCFCGIANYAIYMATIDYMVTAYGPYSASATGGNGWARDFLAGVLTPAALPYYNLPFGDNHIEVSSTILAGIATVLVACVFVIYRKGPLLRLKSPFAQKLEAANQRADQKGQIGVTYIPPGYGTAPASRRHSTEDPTRTPKTPPQGAASKGGQNPRSKVGMSRPATPNISRGPTRNPSPTPGQKKHLLLGSRDQSVFYDEDQAAKITVDHPALLSRRPPDIDGLNPSAVDTLPTTKYHAPSADEPAVRTVKSSTMRHNETAPVPDLAITFGNINWSDTRMDLKVANPADNDTSANMRRG